MATIGTAVTMLDWAKRVAPDGSISAIAEVLAQKNEAVEDVAWVEGNLPTGTRTTIRTGLPTIYFRLLNQGVPPSKSTTVQVDEAAAIMEARGQIDKDLAELNGMSAQFMASENEPFIEAMAQTFATKLFYGNVGTDPEQFSGLSTRYSDNTTAQSKENIIDGGGVGSDNTSIWLVVWGENTIHGVYPKGSTLGLQHEHLGLTDAFDSNGNRFRAYLDWYQWKCGLVVKDWRYAVRIANIDVSNLIASSTAADILQLMAMAVDKIPNFSAGRAAFYTNRTVKTMLRIQTMNKSNVYLTVGNEEGKPKLSFDGIPIRLTDQLLSTEARVV
ncbi:hypothetical protein IVB03_39500 [Bradyrhizobium sp. 168]|uniref:major capsid protein n=1 Tax=Bradyrhizobium sp. 168 TaxID=2782639 RepID=UPI001FFB7F91|nr:hypothetical protein [Bradyrhizobium sp. 168]MCK1585482.1 hypothetical protein [Bradyrhizobium sp. 168]